MNIKLLIDASTALARNNNSGHVTIEHFIYELLKYPDVSSFLRKHGLKKLDRVLSDLDDIFKLSPTTKIKNQNPDLSYDVEIILKQSITYAIMSGRKTASRLDIIMSVLRLDNHVIKLLTNAGLNINNIVSEQSKNNLTGVRQPADKENKVFEPSKNLEKFTKNYNLLAQFNKFMPFFGRDKEIISLCHSLIRRTKNSVLLVGDPGVGKSAIVEGLVQRIVLQDKTIPTKLLNAQIFQLDINDLLAGAKHHGSFEERIKGVFEELKVIPNAILFIDEIQNIIGTGGGGNPDLAAIIKSAISNDNLRVIGTVSTEDYRKYLDKDRNLLRRFNRIDVDEPSIIETTEIMIGIKPFLENFYECEISNEAINASVEFAERYLFDRHFPDKSIDLLDSTLASVKLANDKKNYNITKNDILHEVSKFTKISETVMNESEKTKLCNLKERLEKKIFGQAQAINKLVEAIHISKTGLRAENKTIANILFQGKSATGKTELAKELAKNLGVELLRFDLSAYQEKFSLSVLIGSPPGYLGYSDGRAGDGLLVNAIEKSPTGVILLDEIEKAHPDVLNILLQMMDYGILTSAGGKTVSCRNNILIMTSNIGSELEEKNRIGFGNIDNSDKFDETFKSFFRPEFRSRLDAVIKFNKLGSVELEMIVNKIFDETATLLHKQGITITMTDNLLKYLTKKSETANTGARVVSNLIDSEIKTKLSAILIHTDVPKEKYIIDYDGQSIIVI